MIVEPDLRDYEGADRHDDIESAFISWQRPPGPKYVWGLGGDARGAIIQTDSPQVVEYEAACGTYTDTLFMKYHDREKWRAETQITVDDTIPPQIDRLRATPNILWPANHKMVPVSVSVDASDNCAQPPSCGITSVNSNETNSARYNGGKAPDWIISGDLTVQLRAERSGSRAGRIYTISVDCADASGNQTSGDVTVSVPHDRRSR